MLKICPQYNELCELGFEDRTDTTPFVAVAGYAGLLWLMSRSPFFSHTFGVMASSHISR